VPIRQDVTDQGSSAGDSSDTYSTGATFSLNENLAPAPDKFTPPQAPFNHEKWREITRAGLAFLLTLLLGTVILLFAIAGINGYASTEAKEYLGLVLSPLVGIVGAATGFYYAGGRDSK
jgi:hypothetical protein